MRDQRYIKLGKKLQTARKNKNLNQKDIANLLELTPQSISCYEKGTKAINVFNLKKICKLLDLKIDEVLA